MDGNKFQVFLKKKIKPLTNLSKKLDFFKSTDEEEVESKLSEFIETGNF